INAAGQIAGYYSNAAGIHSFEYINGTITTFDVPNASFTVAQGIDAAGNIAGYFEDNTGGTHGFLYSNGSYTILDAPGALPGKTTVAAMEAGGKIVGFYDSGTNEFGFIYNNGVYTPLDYPGNNDTYGLAINGNGQVAGKYIDLTGTHGF